MTGHIPDTFIDELLARVDIVDILQGRIELKRAGGNFVARCPFHAEKTPSFSVSPSKQFYHCFGCGVHGNALRFLTEYDGMHFVDAVEYLANRVGLIVPRTTSDEEYEKSKQNAEIYTTLAAASDFYHKELLQGTTREKAIQYLKNRGINKETVLDFQLGYAPASWDTLFKALAKDKNAIDQLLAAGLIITKESKPYFDRFRDRLMFPIRNRRGQVVGFGGRIIQDESPKEILKSPKEILNRNPQEIQTRSQKEIPMASPKYLNSPETKVFSKSHELYGLYEARTKLKKMQNLVIVEGYLDVLTLSQFGIKNVVAALGTAFTDRHLEILFREVNELVFCFDGDKAGREAAHRVLLLCLPLMNEGRRVRFMLLPEKEDPDSFMRKQGRDAFEEGLHRAKNLSDFLFESFLTNIDLNQVEGRAEYIRRVRPLIAKVPAGVLQHMLYERLGELARISVEHIEYNEQPHHIQHVQQPKYSQHIHHIQHNENPAEQAHQAYPYGAHHGQHGHYGQNGHHAQHGHQAQFAHQPYQQPHQPHQHQNRQGSKTKYRPSDGPNSRHSGQRPPKYRGPLSPAYKAAALLLANPSLIRYIKTPHGLERGSEPGTLLLCAIIGIFLEEPKLPIQALLEKLKMHEGLEKEISYIANFNDMIAMVPPEGREAEFIGSLDRLEERLFDITLEALLSKAKAAPLSFQEKIELKELLKQKERGG